MRAMVGDAGFFGSSLRVGVLAGLDVRVHVVFMVWVALGVLNAPDPVAVLLADLVLLGSVLLHELAHARGARAVGGEARAVVLWPLGGLSSMRVPASARAELVATGAGPLASLLLTCAGLALVALDGGAPAIVHRLVERDIGLALQWETWPGMTLLGRLALLVAFWNAFLVIFNVLPAWPTDGGALLRGALWPLIGRRRATVVAAVIALAAGAVVVGLGAVEKSGLLVLIGVMVLLASWQELERARAADAAKDA